MESEYIPEVNGFGCIVPPAAEISARRLSTLTEGKGHRLKERLGDLACHQVPEPGFRRARPETARTDGGSNLISGPKMRWGDEQPAVLSCLSAVTSCRLAAAIVVHGDEDHSPGAGT